MARRVQSSMAFPFLSSISLSLSLGKDTVFGVCSREREMRNDGEAVQWIVSRVLLSRLVRDLPTYHQRRSCD